MFSIVIPLYNKELSIKNTIQSVLDQTFQVFEIVVVNDGSSDDSIKRINEFDDPRIRIIHQENQGVSAARNLGVKEANHEWIVFFDADDIWKENHLEVISDMIMEYPDDKVFCTSHTKSKRLVKKQESNETVVIENYFEEVLQHVDFFWTSATCIHTSIFEKTGGFVVGITRGEDLDLWARIGKSNRIIRSTKLTAIYRTNSENKLTSKRLMYHSSILSIINLKGLTGYERDYYKFVIYKRIRKKIREFDFIEIFKIIAKHNIQLLI